MRLQGFPYSGVVIDDEYRRLRIRHDRPFSEAAGDSFKLLVVMRSTSSASPHSESRIDRLQKRGITGKAHLTRRPWRRHAPTLRPH